MPIKGITDRNLAFPEIGAIRKGAPKGENRPGKDLDFFRVEFGEKEASAAQAFKHFYGDKPTEIHIILPFNDIERMWDANLEAYTAGRLVARSDGEKFIYLVNTKTGEVKVRNGQPFMPYTDRQEVGRDYQNKPVYCKPTGRLKVIVPELARAVYLTVMTTSIHDIANISAQLEAFKTLNGGQIAGIPLVLRRRPKKISVPGKDGQRVRMTKWLISIEADPEWVKAKLNEVKLHALPGNGLALPASAGLPDDEPEILQGEYVDEDDDEQPETGVESEQESQPEQPPTKSDSEKPAPPAPANVGEYMSLITKPPFSWTPDQARQVLKDKGNDFAAAWNAAQAQIPPAKAAEGK